MEECYSKPETSGVKLQKILNASHKRILCNQRCLKSLMISLSRYFSSSLQVFFLLISLSVIALRTDMPTKIKGWLPRASTNGPQPPNWFAAGTRLKLYVDKTDVLRRTRISAPRRRPGRVFDKDAFRSRIALHKGTRPKYWSAIVPTLHRWACDEILAWNS